MKKLVNIGLRKERVLLSEILPYETPITFSNNGFYDFVIENEIEVSGKLVTWNDGGRVLDCLMSVLFGFHVSCIEISGNEGKKSAKLNKCLITIPFSYSIINKNSYRNLSVIHPRNQIDVVAFYDKYKELILYFTSKSNFSLRHPSRIARTKFHDKSKKLSSVMLSNQHDSSIAYSNKVLKSFFGYDSIRNINEFFESGRYHDAEKKYDYMAQLDISNCFDSIYTHSIAWAVVDKIIIKDQLNREAHPDLIGSFSDDFDRLMQKQNYNETNGITIGSELSRIFSEVLLQSVDVNVEGLLKNLYFYHGSDYTLYRYVDDYFCFYNDEKVYRSVVDTLSKSLSQFKLSLNKSKEVIHSKPIITKQTIAKDKIKRLLNDHINIEVKGDKDRALVNPEDKKFAIVSLDRKFLTVSFKKILFESEVEYGSVTNYAFSIIESRLKKITRNYVKCDYDYVYHRKMLNSLISLIEFIFFVYDVSPRVTTTIRLTRILKLVIDFVKSKFVSFDEMHEVFKAIFDNSNFVISKFGRNGYAQVETLYILALMPELGKDYWIDENRLVNYLGGNFKSPRTVDFDTDTNYFTIVVTLFYIRDKRRYECTRRALKKLIMQKVDSCEKDKDIDSEIYMLLMDCITCPYLEDGFKARLLSKFNITGRKLQCDVIESRDFWFTDWWGFRLNEALDAKQSEEVY
jgi:hypothetical protein